MNLHLGLQHFILRKGHVKLYVMGRAIVIFTYYAWYSVI